MQASFVNFELFLLVNNSVGTVSTSHAPSGVSKSWGNTSQCRLIRGTGLLVLSSISVESCISLIQISLL